MYCMIHGGLQTTYLSSFRDIILTRDEPVVSLHVKRLRAEILNALVRERGSKLA